VRALGRTVSLAIFVLAAPVLGQSPHERRLRGEDGARLAEAMRLAAGVRSTVWPGWERTPLVVLLVGDSLEHLIGHPRPTDDFSPIGRDPLVGKEVFVRHRQFPPDLLATFPAVGGVSTIVVGSPARTGKASAEWVLTLLHEHFHQWQSSLPDYYARAEGLGLARGDTTGRWMLDYPFPYDSAPVGQAVRALAVALARALDARDAAAIDLVRRERETIRRLLSPEDERYLEFQLWQEGVPRYVELAAAEAAAGLGAPKADFRRLPDYEPYAVIARRMRRELSRELLDLSLARDRRVAFYPLGAGLGLLLERSGQNWKSTYRQRPFSLPLSP
jgi:hypothetical protein